jgi:hypothetical protein
MDGAFVYCTSKYICVSFYINCAWSNLSIISPVCVLDYWKAPFLHALRYMVIDICYSIVQYVIIMHNSILAWVRVIGCCMLQQPSSFIPRYVAGLSAGLTVAGSWIDRRPVGFRELLASMTSFIERGFTGRSLPSRSCSASICPGPPGCVWYVRWGSSGGMRDKHTLHTVILPHKHNQHTGSAGMFSPRHYNTPSTIAMRGRRASTYTPTHSPCSPTHVHIFIITVSLVVPLLIIYLWMKGKLSVKSPEWTIRL